MFMPNVDVFAEISIVEYRQNERDITLSNNFHCFFFFFVHLSSLNCRQFLSFALLFGYLKIKLTHSHTNPFNFKLEVILLFDI